MRDKVIKIDCTYSQINRKDDKNPNPMAAIDNTVPQFYRIKNNVLK